MTITPAMIKELREQTGAGFGDVKNALTEAEGNMEQAVVILRKKGLAAAGKKAGRVTAEGTIAARVDGSVGVIVEVNCETDFVGRNEVFQKFAADVANAIAQSRATSVEEFLAENWPGTSEPVSQKVAEQIASIKENISIRRFARYEAPETAKIGTYIHAGGKIGVMVEVLARSGNTGSHLDEVAKDIAMHVAAINPAFISSADVPADEVARERAVFVEQAKSDPKTAGKTQEIVAKIIEGKVRKWLGEITLLGQPFVKDDKQTVEQYLKNAGGEVAAIVRYEVGAGIEKKQEDFAAEVAKQVESAKSKH